MVFECKMFLKTLMVLCVIHFTNAGLFRIFSWCCVVLSITNLVCHFVIKIDRLILQWQKIKARTKEREIAMANSITSD